MVLVDASLVPLLAQTLAEMTTVRARRRHRRGRHLRAGRHHRRRCTTTRPCWPPRPAAFDWPAVLGEPGRRHVLHLRHHRQPQGRRLQPPLQLPALGGVLHGERARACGETDRVLPIVPQFHANAWGLIYAAFMAGADLVMPDRFLQAEPLTRLIAAEQATVSGAVPTIWNDIRLYGEDHELDLSSLRVVACGGSAVPRSLMQHFEEKYGVRHPAGLGDDRDLAAGLGGERAQGRARRAGLGLPHHRRADHLRRRGAGSPPTTARCCPPTARRSARSRSVVRGSPAATTSTRTRRSSTTAGCAPATSATSTRGATSP